MSELGNVFIDFVNQIENSERKNSINSNRAESTITNENYSHLDNSSNISIAEQIHLARVKLE